MCKMPNPNLIRLSRLFSPSSHTGTELLKNLVLPGIGAFTIVDSERVEPQDTGSNFFVTADAIGSSRGQCAVALLRELNAEVRGSSVEEGVDAILDAKPNFFSQFSLVIVTELPETSRLRLAKVLWASATPLLVARSYGLLGSIRLAVPEHKVVESHPDNFHEDLRLDVPFPELSAYVDSLDLVAMDDTHHGNVPFLVLLFKFVQEWRASHDGEIPRNYQEKKAFKEILKAAVRTNAEGVPLDEDNFDEAIQNVNSLLIPTQIPAAVQAILDDPACTCITADSSNFWLLARALRDFATAEGNGLLPLRGSIPDMTASSDLYIQLSRLYQARARADMEAVSDHLGQLLVSVGRPPNSIPEEDIRRFCRNSSFLSLTRFRSLSAEHEAPNLSPYLENGDGEAAYYVLLRAADQFFARYKFYPGQRESEFDSDAAQLKSIAHGLLTSWGRGTSCIRDEQVAEFCRYAGGEVHSVAAFVGGVAAQEVIKLLTHQFVPVNHTLLYNAASSSTITLCP